MGNFNLDEMVFGARVLLKNFVHPERVFLGWNPKSGRAYVATPKQEVNRGPEIIFVEPEQIEAFQNPWAYETMRYRTPNQDSPGERAPEQREGERQMPDM